MLEVFSRSDRLRPNTILLRLNGTKSNKSSVDDFDMELGIVRVRVGLSYDPLRLSPSSGDLWKHESCTVQYLCIPPTPSPKQPPTNNTNKQHNRTTAIHNRFGWQPSHHTTSIKRRMWWVRREQPRSWCSRSVCVVCCFCWG